MNHVYETTEKFTRWDISFSEETSEEQLERLLSMAPFNAMDPGHFPPHLALRDILRNDTRVREYDPGEIIVREGEYGNSAFMIMNGRVRIVLRPSLSPEALGRGRPSKAGLLHTLGRMWRRPQFPEVRKQHRSTLMRDPVWRSGEDKHAKVFLSEPLEIVKSHETVLAERGAFICEISALGRVPRTATVFAESEVELLEVRWQGLRDLMRYDEGIKSHIDTLYRKHDLAQQMRKLPLFMHLEPEAMQRVVNSTIFETHGEYDWHASYKKVAEATSEQGSALETVIAEEGHYPNGLILVRSGFARLSRRAGRGRRAISYLGRGRMFGLREVVHNWRDNEQTPFQYSLSALSYVLTMVIPISVMETIVLPTIPTEELDRLMDESGEPPLPTVLGTEPEAPIDSSFFEFLVDRRFINGRAAMAIDLERCTRCDDCVRACAATHDNNPRFRREGPVHEGIMIANACMHCADPVCMIGCPTGAIHRDMTQGEVVINDLTCISCGVCADNCPYDAITLVDIRNSQGNFYVEDLTSRPARRATKCDLCYDLSGGPACEAACPHDALQRIDLSDPQRLGDWLKT